MAAGEEAGDGQGSKAQQKIRGGLGGDPAILGLQLATAKPCEPDMVHAEAAARLAQLPDLTR